MAGDITQILSSWETDKNNAIEQLTPLVYSELHKIAASYMRRAKPDHTLQATALINEAYMRMVRQEGSTFKDRTHFFALAARIMRSILVDFARARASQKRGSGNKVQLDREISLSADGASDFLMIHEALDKLKEFDERKAAVIELRYFGGLNFEEVAETLGISLITARRDAAFAEAWLRRALSTSASSE
jgi:RNA polymerase sigma-70 factor (ECF subfamily)